MHSTSSPLCLAEMWLTGIPRAGKTVLSSFVINRCSEVSCKKPWAPTLYFFFKMTDSDKNSVLAVTRSLLYQLCSLFPASLSADTVSLRNSSGKDTRRSHVKSLANLTIVLDALIECNEVNILLGRMIPLLQCCRANMLVVSWTEESITLALEEYPNIIIGHKNIEADIHSYITAEIERSPRF